MADFLLGFGNGTKRLFFSLGMLHVPAKISYI